jgi:hypothetical protein
MLRVLSSASSPVFCWSAKVKAFLAASPSLPDSNDEEKRMIK